MANPEQEDNGVDSDEIRCISLCSGYEGIGLGLRRVLPNLRIVAYAEIEEYACAVLAARMEEGKLDIAPIWTDIKTFPAEAFHGKVHIITAGYPCQPFSVAGKRRGGTDERHLWRHICSIIESVEPLYVCTENVSGVVSARILDNRPDIVEYLTALAKEERKADARGRWYIGWHRERLTARLLQQEGIQALAGVYLDLHDLGYKVEAGLFTAAEVGAPHKRQRLFILAHASGSSGSGREQEKRKRNRLDISPVHRTRQWPARPGEPQYEWEEPRVVEYARSRTPKRLSQSEERNIDREVRNTGRQGQAQPVVGGTANECAGGMDATANRVDRLRLLGNGCLPAQVERAFRELMRQQGS